MSAVQLTGRFWANTPTEAAKAAREWIAGEPRLLLRTIARIRPATDDAGVAIPAFDVTVSVSARESDIGWWRKPGGSVHAFRGIRTFCDRFTWQATWGSATGDEPDACPVCVELAGAPMSAMSEDQLVAAYGGLPMD